PLLLAALVWGHVQIRQMEHPKLTGSFGQYREPVLTQCPAAALDTRGVSDDGHGSGGGADDGPGPAVHRCRVRPGPVRTVVGYVGARGHGEGEAAYRPDRRHEGPGRAGGGNAADGADR